MLEEEKSGGRGSQSMDRRETEQRVRDRRRWSCSTRLRRQARVSGQVRTAKSRSITGIRSDARHPKHTALPPRMRLTSAATAIQKTDKMSIRILGSWR